MPSPEPHDFSSVAIVAVTDNGVRLALELQQKLPGSECHVPQRHAFALSMGAFGFERLKDLFPRLWPQSRGIICIMATGIVVRLIAPLVEHKRKDPAVVVMDERGQFVISLLSGHWGGANRLAARVADAVHAHPVITTATDVHGKPAWDLLAQELGLEMENPSMLPRLNRALLEDELLWIHDPAKLLAQRLENNRHFQWIVQGQSESFAELAARIPRGIPGVWVSERLPPPDLPCLKLFPRTLVLGVGCNRGTPAEEILELIKAVFDKEALSLSSIRNLTSIDIKADEAGLFEAARRLDRPLTFHSRQAIENVQTPNPSEVVAKHIGASSVCEATALLDARTRNLIIPKQKGRNVTLAAAKVASPS